MKEHKQLQLDLLWKPHATTHTHIELSRLESCLGADKRETDTNSATFHVLVTISLKNLSQFLHSLPVWEASEATTTQTVVNGFW